MQFDLFHSIGRVDSVTPRLSDSEVFLNFFSQAKLAEELGFDTVWVAESHFSSETQKSHEEPVIPNYHGEVGLNCDAMQLFAMVKSLTKRINFGTAIHNIVGGNGGPIASADRVRTMAFLNQLSDEPRDIYLGMASGRFPYINKPFGVVPRDDVEKEHWRAYKRMIFLEALEIFLRLSLGEAISSDDLRCHTLPDTDIPYRPRWQFEKLRLVPELDDLARTRLHFVLGSHDPLAHELAMEITDTDLFNLSFTPPEKLNEIHRELELLCARLDRKPWARRRLPRTVLIFIDESSTKAVERAEQCFATYIDAMKGTVRLPPKETLMERALIGTPDQICQQLDPESERKFHADDRLMLWFEFNQTKNDDIRFQMELFADKVKPHFD